jgi:hypothetical protein
MKVIKIKPQLKYSLLFFVGLLFFMSSCKKEEIDITEPENVIEETELLKFSLSGTVVDEMNNPIENVEVAIDDNYTSTDENGFYHFDNINAHGIRAKIQFGHANYFKGYKTTEVGAGGRFHVNVILVLLKDGIELPSSQGGEVLSSGGVKINFPADAFVKADGSRYNGNVKVYLSSLDPTTADIAGRFPSDFEVLSRDKERQLMQVYAGVGVELYSDAGEPLEINKPVSMELPIPAELLSTAPATISLGHYDEALGIWEEDGEGTLVGDHYLTEVDHFSYWCCFVMQDLTKILGFVLEEIDNGQSAIPVKDIFIKVSIANSAIASFTRSAGDGFFSMKVPKGLDLVLEIYANSFDTECGIPVYTLAIPALTTFQNFGNLLIEAPEMITVTGVVQDCSQQNITSGYVLATNQEDQVLVSYIEADGSFSLAFYSCNDQIKITAYDIDFTRSSEVLVLPNTNNDIVLGTMLACEVVTEPPYLLRAITGGDTLIGTAASGFTNNAYDSDGNLMTLVHAYFEIDIQNTSQDLNVAGGIIVNISGVEDEACEVGYCEISIPLKDAMHDSYQFRIHSSNPNYATTWIQTYNCIDGADYLHFEGEGVLVEQGTGNIITNRDPLVFFDIYFQL